MMGYLYVALLLCLPISSSSFSTSRWKAPVEDARQNRLFRYQQLRTTAFPDFHRQRVWATNTAVSAAHPLSEDMKDAVTEALEADDLSFASYVADYYKDSILKQRIASLESTVRNLLARLQALESKPQAAAAPVRSGRSIAEKQAESAQHNEAINSMWTQFEQSKHQQQQQRLEQEQARNAWQDYLRSTLGTPPQPQQPSSSDRHAAHMAEKQKPIAREQDNTDYSDDDYEEEYGSDYEYEYEEEEEEYDEYAAQRREEHDSSESCDEYEYDDEQDDDEDAPHQPHQPSQTSQTGHTATSQQHRDVDPYAADQKPRQTASATSTQQQQQQQQRQQPQHQQQYQQPYQRHQTNAAWATTDGRWLNFETSSTASSSSNFRAKRSNV